MLERSRPRFPVILWSCTGTRLHRRMQQEGRLLTDATGDNTDFSINFVSTMNNDTLVNGYRRILGTIYAPKHYYARVRKFLQEYEPPKRMQGRFKVMYFRAMAQSVVRLGILGRERFQYWKLFFWSLALRPRLFPLAITFSIYGFHFRQVLRRHEKKLRRKGSGYRVQGPVSSVQGSGRRRRRGAWILLKNECHGSITRAY